MVSDNMVSHSLLVIENSPSLHKSKKGFPGCFFYNISRSCQQNEYFLFTPFQKYTYFNTAHRKNIKDL